METIPGEPKVEVKKPKDKKPKAKALVKPYAKEFNDLIRKLNANKLESARKKLFFVFNNPENDGIIKSILDEITSYFKGEKNLTVKHGKKCVTIISGLITKRLNEEFKAEKEAAIELFKDIDKKYKLHAKFGEENNISNQLEIINSKEALERYIARSRHRQRLKDFFDREIIKITCKNFPWFSSIKDVQDHLDCYPDVCDEELLWDFKAFLKAGTKHTYLLSYAKTDELTIKSALLYNGLNLKNFHSEKPKLDYIKIALRSNGMALKFVGTVTKELLSIAVKQNPLAIRYMREYDDKIIVDCLKRRGTLIQFIYPRLAGENYEKYKEIAVNQNPLASAYFRTIDQEEEEDKSTKIDLPTTKDALDDATAIEDNVDLDSISDEDFV